MTPRRIAFMLLALLLACCAMGAWAQPQGCDSCNVRVQSLDAPIPLRGNWLFTRDDSPHNKDVDADTRHWVLAATPGNWSTVYGDGKNFAIGWYRAEFEFNPELIGQEVVLLADLQQSRVNVYLDGEDIFHRPDDVNVTRYYMLQPIPLRFTITQKHHVFAMRVNTQNMVGVTRLPFDLRRYNPQDSSLSFYAFSGGELRLMTGAITLFFGFFFALLCVQTRAVIYLWSALASLGIGVFLTMQTDMMAQFFEPETLQHVSTLGLYGFFPSWVFCQHYHKLRPVWLNATVGVVFAAILLVSIANGLYFHNLDWVVRLRPLLFVCLLGLGIAATYETFRGARAGQPGATLLCLCMGFFVFTSVHDILLALGLVTSQTLSLLGIRAWTGALLAMASSNFANAFLENRRLVSELKGANDNLENIVRERTDQLREKAQDIEVMMGGLSQGVLTIIKGDIIHPEYSAHLEEIFETKNIAGRRAVDVVFAATTLEKGLRAQVEAAVASCIGEDRNSFDFNQHLLVSECDKAMPDGRLKSLQFTWSPICDANDVIDKIMLCVRDVTETKQLAAEAAQQRKKLEMIGEILSVNQDKFHEFMDDAGHFISENEQLIKNAGKMRKGAVDTKAVTTLFSNMHAIKSTAQAAGLQHLTTMVEEAEQSMAALTDGPESEVDKDQLLQKLASTQAAIAEHSKINEVTLGRRGPGRRGGVDHFLMAQKDDIQRALAVLDNMPTDDVGAMREAIAKVKPVLEALGTETMPHLLQGVVDGLPALARELGKEPPMVRIDDHQIAIKNQIADLLRNVFKHLYRNAMDHGLESGDARVAAGKPAQGTITLHMALRDGRVWFTLSDDGRGLALAAIEAKARSNGLIAPDQTPTPQEVAQMIFAPGFSTVETGKGSAAKGVGMDAVQNFVSREQGTIAIHLLAPETAESRFCPFETVISFPAKFVVQMRT